MEQQTVGGAPSPQKGMMLVALPALLDPNFRQTVILLCEHNSEGSLGLIVNRPTDAELSNILPEAEAFRDRQDSVYEGGPVQKNALMALYHGLPAAEAVSVFGDIYLTGNLGALDCAVSIQPGHSRVRFYLGYAGWSPLQLEGELAAGGWKLLPGDPDLVFGSEAPRLWSDMMRSLGDEFEMYSHMPEDPSSN